MPMLGSLFSSAGVKNVCWHFYPRFRGHEIQRDCKAVEFALERCVGRERTYIGGCAYATFARDYGMIEILRNKPMEVSRILFCP